MPLVTSTHILKSNKVVKDMENDNSSNKIYSCMPKMIFGMFSYVLPMHLPTCFGVCPNILAVKFIIHSSDRTSQYYFYSHALENK